MFYECCRSRATCSTGGISVEWHHEYLYRKPSRWQVDDGRHRDEESGGDRPAAAPRLVRVRKWDGIRLSRDELQHAKRLELYGTPDGDVERWCPLLLAVRRAERVPVRGKFLRKQGGEGGLGKRENCRVRRGSQQERWVM